MLSPTSKRYRISLLAVTLIGWQVGQTVSSSFKHLNRKFLIYTELLSLYNASPCTHQWLPAHGHSCFIHSPLLDSSPMCVHTHTHTHTHTHSHTHTLNYFQVSPGHHFISQYFVTYFQKVNTSFLNVITVTIITIISPSIQSASNFFDSVYF